VSRSFAIALACAGALACGSGKSDEPPSTDERPIAPPATAASTFVGATACGECHADELRAWRGSHHDLAMQEATAQTVLGDFDDHTFTHRGDETRLFRRNDEYLVSALGADGKRADFPVRYVFGVDPLQQLLIDTGDGRLQALSVAWDARPQDAGGQRWFHLHPDEAPPPGDRLHWASPAYQWNDMCADCHSTDVALGYDAKANTFDTTYSEIDVACEACHGPGSNHVAWAGARDPTNATRGFDVQQSKPGTRAWTFADGAAIARLSGASNGDPEVETCAPCHSRRSFVGGEGDFHDRYRTSLLEEGLYFPDGQIRDEVYVYGSFVQSRMHAAGVVCSDCHDPHTLTLRAEGNALCATCHDATVYASASHHFHEADSTGAQCVECHMPARTYMVVDPRRDHRFGVPRPDISEKLGTPNACTGCHDGKTAAWARTELDKQRGGPTKRPSDGPDPSTAAIVRATALIDRASSPSPKATELLKAAVTDADPLVRRAAAQAITAAPSPDRLAIVAPLLRDEVRSVRLEAAAAYLAADRPKPTAGVKAAIAEYREAREATANRAESMVDLAFLALRDGDSAEAERLLRAAIAAQPDFAPGHLNLADLFRAAGRDADAAAVLEAALDAASDTAVVHFALGLAYVRLKRTDDALTSLRAAYDARPEVQRYGYVYSVALFDLGKRDTAIGILRMLRTRFPDDVEVLTTLIGFLDQTGQTDAANELKKSLPGR
jgi:predicted CXXCH cytochrome family protein